MAWGGEAALWGLIRRAVVCRPDVGVCFHLSIYLSTCTCTQAITAALGFDTFVVMRHGLRTADPPAAPPADAAASTAAASTSTAASTSAAAAASAAASTSAAPPAKEAGHESRLGCYFCNDVVAPANPNPNPNPQPPTLTDVVAPANPNPNPQP